MNRISILRRLRALRRDQRGVAAVEFAMVAPIMILLYFGVAEGAQVMMAERKTIRTASAIGDLVAQYSSLTGAQVDDIIELGDVLMKPFPTDTQLKVCVTSIEADAEGVKKIGWMRKKNNPDCPAKGSPVSDTPELADLIGKNQSLIMARVTYVYEGPSSKIISSPTMVKTFYLRPRKSQSVLCPSC